MKGRIIVLFMNFSFLLLIINFINFSQCGASTTVTTTLNCTVLSDINGCSVPLGLPFPYKARFTPACNRHDVCYRCGVKYGWNQRECDQAFYNNMLQSCNSMNSSVATDGMKKYKRGFVTSFKQIFNRIKAQLDQDKDKNGKSSFTIIKESAQLASLVIDWQNEEDNTKEECIAGAKVYHKTVQTFGYSSYRSISPAFCDEKCAKRIGNPTVRS